VASEFFLPSVEFEKFRISTNDLDYLKIEISNYAILQKLSSTHISYRLYKRGDINKSLWNSLREFYYNKWTENQEITRYKNNQKDGGPGYYILQKYKLGTLVGLVQRLTYAEALEYESQLLDSQGKVVEAEAKGQSWMQRNWRPITMLTFLVLVVCDSFGLLKFRLSNEAWTLLQIGLGGYVIGRTGEKIVDKIQPKV
jgi:hypothetical protein